MHANTLVQQVRLWISGFLFGMTAGIPALYADDTEVFFGRTGPNVNTAANVLFILDNSGSMRDFDYGPIRRIDQMKQAMLEIIENTDDVNIGLATFNGNSEGGAILFPVTDVDEEFCADAACSELVTVGRMHSGLDDATQKLQGSFDVTLGWDDITMGENPWDDNNSVVAGMRFSGLNIPRGATINSAYIEMTATDDAGDSASYTIVGELTANAQPYADTTKNISARNTTLAAEHWTPEKWDYAERYLTNDVSSIVQEITSQAGWCGGNALALMITGSGYRLSKSFEGEHMAAAVLKVNYDPSSVNFDNTCLSSHAVASVKSSNDDATESKADQSVEVGNTVLAVPLGTDEKTVGLRFGQVSVPQGAIVTDAYIELQSAGANSGPVSLNIAGEAADSAAPFSAQVGNLGNRTRTGTPLAWSGMPDLGLDQRVKSPDISSIVNTIVNRAGWQKYNAMAFFIDRASGSGSTRFMHSFDGSKASAARLHIQYQAPSSSANIPVLQTARERLSQVVYDFRGLHWTQLVDAYLEGVEYMLGRPVYHGKQRGEQDAHDDKHFRLSHPDSYTGGTVQRDSLCSEDNLSDAACVDEIIAGNAVYKSPIENTCQSNQIILLSDGEPTHNASAGEIKQIIGGNCVSHDSDDDQLCGRELATWLSTNDISSTIDDKQTIVTSTVGFKFSDEFLRDIAKQGGGEFHEADSATELTRAFQSIFNTIADVDTTFVAPSVAVNQFNRLTNRSDIYFSLFKPGLQPKWAGNVKKYMLGVDSSSGDNTVQIIDADGNAAINAVTGGFNSTARSLWSDTIDGADVTAGGAAAELALGRKVTTYLPGDANFISRDLNLTTHITKDLLGIPAMSDAYHSNLLAWAVGIDVNDVNKNSSTTDIRQELGDPMHSEPTLINYADVGGVATSVLFFGTNEGFLHAVNSTDGTELSAFIPPELLPNLNKFYVNNASAPHPYGLDGPISGWIRDDDNNNLTVDSGEHAMLFVGMRRGGNNYYAIDVSDPTDPQVEWVIEGGTSGFEKLGQTWSKPIVSKVRMGTAEKDVLIFAGGYDVANDSSVDRMPSNSGNAIFIVDAQTGSLIWSATAADFPDMLYSIPSNIRVIDQDADGTADRLYVGDMGAQLWRFDIDNHTSTTTALKVSGGVLAELGGSGAENNRRFFYEPDVALVNQDGKDFLAVSLGSGWRAHPLDTVVKDRFYSIRDYAVYSPLKDTNGKATYQAFGEDDLTDVTSYTAGVEPAVTNGWFLNMESNGEKVLGEAVTVNYQIIFTSYLPENSVSACTAAVGSGSVYVVDVFNAAPVLNLDESLSADPAVDNNTLTKSDRQRQLRQVGIPPSPKVLFPDNSPPITLTGGEKLPVEIEPRTRTYWVEK